MDAPADDICGLFQHANELLDIIDEEINNEPEEGRADMRSGEALILTVARRRSTA
jgi:hypothetical protein